MKFFCATTFTILIVVVASLSLLATAATTHATTDDSFGCPSLSSSTSSATFRINVLQSSNQTKGISTTDPNNFLNPFFNSLGYNTDQMSSSPNLVRIIGTITTPTTTTAPFQVDVSVASDDDMKQALLTSGNANNNNNGVQQTSPFYTRNAIEMMLTTLFRNASSSTDVVASLDLIGWDSVQVLSASCSTNAAARMMMNTADSSSMTTMDTLSFSSSSSTSSSSLCNNFAVNGTNSNLKGGQSLSSSQKALQFCNWNANQQNQIQAAFSQLFGGAVSVPYSQVVNFTDKGMCPQTFSFSNTFNDTAAALQLISQLPMSELSSAIDSLVFRNSASASSSAQYVFQLWNRLSVNISNNNNNNNNVSSSTTCSSAANQDSTLFVPSAAKASIDFLIPFQCGTTMNDDQNSVGVASSSSSLLELHDAMTVASNIASNSSLLSLALPLTWTIVNYTYKNVNGTSFYRCGIRMTPVVSDSTSPSFNSTQRLYSCLSLWANQSGNAAQIMSGPPKAVAAPAKQPPLLMISMIATAVLWVVLCAYCYKFLPRTRRTNFPHQEFSQQALEEAMLTNDEQKEKRGVMNNSNNSNRSFGSDNNKRSNMSPKEGNDGNEVDDNNHEDMNQHNNTASNKKKSSFSAEEFPNVHRERETETNKIFAM